METLPTNDQTNASPGPLLQPSETVLANTAVVAQPRVLAREYVPNKPLFGDQEAEIEFYARSPFTAWEHALLRGRPHPKLWKIIKGSPFEWLYRDRFGNDS